MAFAEITVSPSTPMPRDYKLLRKGYAFMTALCRRKTMAAGRTLYVVRSGSTTIGLRAPRHIVHETLQEERQTRDARRDAVTARNETTRCAFAAALRRQFPGMPAEDAEKVLQRTLRKRSGRVGRSSKLGIEDKVRLAVVAHVRHAHTEYDGLVGNEQMSRENARKEVYDSVQQKPSWLLFRYYLSSDELPLSTRGPKSVVYFQTTLLRYCLFLLSLRLQADYALQIVLRITAEQARIAKKAQIDAGGYV
ncbi:hypothetical protein ISF_02604 [Cordyceps fumosorosea ARSEF 2679]|uniref:DUF2293 domain-containing protein n=1 Tax=Cordyceps fumosorosea (strain ARSEF 2679) TaxID=1081104 RepID=A0A168BWB4_CORFA|nr:hypothetical protein ISF_02604 [Cordyceps fumosorosea ARSEF 2679]OAA70630.1 hypothetical protein ISF_02604 [Cordyceps fumosorosea ARSEF 2679]